LKFSELEETYQDFYVPQFQISVNGKDLLDRKDPVEVFGVTVNNTLDGADDFAFTVNNPVEPESREFPYLVDGRFEVGADVLIQAGYVDKIKPLLKGLITSVDVSFPSNGVSQLTIKGFDYSHKMMKKKLSESFGSTDEPVKFSDIVNQIAGKEEYRLGTDNIVDTGQKHRLVKQDRESDYDFIKKKLADRIGFEVFVFEDNIYFRPPASNKEEVLTMLEWGKTLLQFSPQVNIANQVTEVQVRGWNPDNQEPIVGRARRGDEHGRDRRRQSGGDRVEASQGSVVRHYWIPVADQQEADRLAGSILDKLSEGFVKGTGECIGIPDILPGNNIELNGLGSKFSKKYYIEKTTHSITTSGYKTTFTVKENTI
jgi:phage protein D